MAIWKGITNKELFSAYKSKRYSPSERKAIGKELAKRSDVSLRTRQRKSLRRSTRFSI